jgi:hypothetical protein
VSVCIALGLAASGGQTNLVVIKLAGAGRNKVTGCSIIIIECSGHNVELWIDLVIISFPWNFFLDAD